MPFDVAPIAEAHGIETEALQASLAASGWNFTLLADGVSERNFVARLVTEYAERLAEQRDQRKAREERQAAQRLAAMTSEARANPNLLCTRCDGKGHIRGFGHIANGTCFACSGAGIIRRRSHHKTEG